MTTLSHLAQITGGQLEGVSDGDSVEVTSATLDSSQIVDGTLFCAVPGTRTHGASYAAGSGAAAVLTDAAGARIIAEAGGREPLLIVEDVRRWMGEVSAEIYSHPAEKLTVIGITGTSGKTTTSYLVEKALASKHSVGIIGTTGTRINGVPIDTKLTTPEAPTMQGLLAQMVSEGVTHVVMEVSSHALALGRVRGISFDVAAFTNLSQDHLDFHPTMEEYFDTKATLFTAEYGSPRSVICIDDAWGRKLADRVENSGLDVLRVSSDTRNAEVSEAAGSALWRVTDVSVAPTGEQHIEVESVANSQSRQWRYSIALAGSFNVANSLVALACAEAAGESLDPTAIATVQVPGRMQSVTAGQDFLAMVDYAHKPAAVASVVSTLADYMPQPDGRICMVLGAGGNRDHDKRPKMGYEAAKVAHAVIVTDDNPRDEDPAEIRQQVMSGALRAASEREDGEVFVKEIGDRGNAIRYAVNWAQAGDAVVIAGKGHEKGQLIAGVMHEFDEVEELKSALVQRFGRGVSPAQVADNDEQGSGSENS